MKRVGRLHVITDAVLQNRFSHEEVAALAIEGGADAVQYRQKEGAARQLLATAERLRALCQRAGVPLLVNDRVDIGWAAGAHGVHLGQDDLPVELARKLLGPVALIGASARSEQKILEAVQAGADYIGFGPIYATSSKADAERPKGLEGLRRMAEKCPVPVIAIGGITPERVAEVMGAGAHGLAVISAVCCQADPREATRRLKQAIESTL